MLNFNDLRSKSMKEKMKQQLDNVSQSGFKKEIDTRLYLPKLSKDDTDNTVDVRFLPSIHEYEGEPLHLAVFKKHSFDVGNKTFYAPCLKILGKECPVCKTLQWSDHDESLKKIYRDRKAKPTYYTNVYIISDQMYPEENGTVRIMPFGPQLMKAITDSIKEENINMFDIFENGATFRIRIKVKGINPATGKMFPTFEASSFRSKSVFMEEVEEAEKIFKQTHNLSDFISIERFKTYEEIEAKMKEFNLLKIDNDLSIEKTNDYVSSVIAPFSKPDYSKPKLSKSDVEEYNEPKKTKKEVQEKTIIKEDVDILDDDEIDKILGDI